MSNNTDNLSVSDYSKICRTCLAQGEMKCLSDNCCEDNCLIEMLMSVTFVQISEKDGLPFQICLNCEIEVIRAFNFAQNCAEVESKLKSCYKDFQNKIRTSLYSSVTVQNDEPSESIPASINEPEIVADKVPREIVEIEHNYSDKQNDEKLIKSVSDSVQKPRRKRLRRPKLKLKPGESYECKKCFEKFTTSKLLWIHYKEVKHPPGRWGLKTCQICSKSVKYFRLENHMRVHTKEKPFSCEFCGKRFSLQGNLSRHLKIHTGVKPHKCSYCDRAFIQSTNLKDHLRTHTGETPFICDICGKGFIAGGLLKLHLKNHAEGKPNDSASPQFKCDICLKKYHTKSVLANHKLIHGEKKFLCSFCGRGFVNKAALQIHTNTHTGTRPYTCLTCGKSFTQPGTLKSHNLTHTGFKPYTCKICNRGFTQGQHLKYHLRTHSGEKPYNCTICGKNFSQNMNLKIHVRTHTGEKPYLCFVCGKGFYDSSSMNKHRRKVHEKEK